MAYSSILGADTAPAQPSGRSNDLLGPSDNSDSGSDAVGTVEERGDTDGSGTGERGAVFGAEAVPGADIGVDRVVRLGAGGEMEDAGDELGSGNGFPEADPDGQEMTDIDADPDADTDADADGAAR